MLPVLINQECRIKEIVYCASHQFRGKQLLLRKRLAKTEMSVAQISLRSGTSELVGYSESSNCDDAGKRWPRYHEEEHPRCAGFEY